VASVTFGIPQPTNATTTGTTVIARNLTILYRLMAAVSIAISLAVKDGRCAGFRR
jgi:hypothetical protein